MFFIVFEATVPPSRAAISEEYYAKMQGLVRTQPGFISEIPFASPHHEGGQVLITRWVDEAGVHDWRLQHDHLMVQYKARDHILDEYRLRVGPEVSLNENEENHGEQHVTSKKGHFIVLYERPVKEGMTTPSPDVTDLLDPAKGSASEVAASLVDTNVYQGEKSVLWISSWPTKTAAISFKKSIHREEGDDVHLIQVVRDYGKDDREEAPEGAGAAQAASVSEVTDTAPGTAT